MAALTAVRKAITEGKCGAMAPALPGCRVVGAVLGYEMRFSPDVNVRTPYNEARAHHCEPDGL
jgi:hypothetical protein